MQIRFADQGDAAQIASIYAPYCGDDSAVSFEIEPPSAAQMRDRITRIGETYPWLVADESGEILGYVYACSHRERAAYRWSIDVAVYVHPQHRRQGIARILYETLFDLLRWQGFTAAHAGITVPNASSVGLHESLGFRLVGIYPRVGFKAGQWRDVGWWQLALGVGDASVDNKSASQGTQPTTPTEPIAASAARRSPEWLQIIERANNRASGQHTERTR